MHVLSKVLLAVVVLATIAAIFLTSMMYDARTAWLKKISEREEQAVSTQEELRKKKITVAAARDEVNRLLNLWGNSWESQQNQVMNPQLGAVALGAGGNMGIGVRENAAGTQLPSVHLFAPGPQGSKYLGEFRITALEASKAAAQLIRTPYPGEAQQWPAGQWRIRESVPSNWRTLFTSLHAGTTETIQDIQDQNVRLATQDKLIVKSNDQLQRRLMQLDGDADPLEGASEVVINGLVESLRKEETNRDQHLAQLDSLRHEYDRKFRRLLTLLDENRALEQQLPQPGGSLGTSAPKAADALSDNSPSVR